MTSVNYSPQAKERSIKWWLGGLVLLLPIMMMFQQGEPALDIVVSRETTFITDPLKADGLPDYSSCYQKCRGAPTTSPSACRG